MTWTRAVFLGCVGVVWACSSTPGPGGAGNTSGTGNGGQTSGNGSGSGSSNGSGTGGADSGSASGSGSGTNINNPGSGSASGSGSSSGSITTDSGTASGSSSGSGPAPPSVDGCTVGSGKAKFYQVPDDTAAPGPWPVGVKTLMIAGMTGGTRPVEIWYPAQLGSEASKPKVSYNVSSWLPGGAGGAEAKKIPASANSPQPCDCYRDLPLDTSMGPYPAVIFFHGTGSFRTASLSAMTQWASRGFIAVAADHAGLYLADFLITGSGGACSSGGSGINYPGSNLPGDADVMIAGMKNATGDFAFLGKNVDLSRIAFSGHSAGASAAATSASKPNVQVDMPLADLGGTVPTGSALKSVLLMGGTSDSVVGFSSDQGAYSSASAAIKRIVGITNGNHLDVIDLCMDTNMANPPMTGIEVAKQYNVCGAGTLAALAQCGTVMPVTAGPEIVKYATTATLEETLHCANRDAAFSMLASKYPQVTMYQHTP